MLALILAFALAAPASEGISSEKAQELGNRLATCAGVWDFLAEIETENNRPTSAKQAADTARGAMIAAQYLMFIQDRATNEGSTKTLNSFAPMFEGRRESGRTSMGAMIEREDLKGFEIQIDACGSLLTLQETIINQIRQGLSE